MNQRKAGILLNYLGEAVKILTALVYTPVMLRLLGQSEYGLYQLVSSTVSYLSLLSLGFGSAYVRFYSRCRVQNDDAGIARLNGMFMSIFGVMTVICLLCGGVMAANIQTIFGSGLTAAETAKAKILLSILIVNMALTFPNSVFNCYITAHEAFMFQKVLMLLQNVLSPFLALPLLLMGYGSVAIVMVSTVLTVVCLTVNICFCAKKLKMRFAFRDMKFALLKEMWVFTFFIFLNQIIDMANWGIDKFLLGRMCGTTAVAVYGVGGQINSLYLQMSTAISTVFVPKVNRIVAKTDDNCELTDLMAKVGRVQFIVLALIISGFSLFGRPFIRLWVGTAYEDSFRIALLLMVPVTVPLVQNIGIEIQRAKNLHRARSCIYAGLAAANVALSIFLIRRWGSIGAAAGTTVSLILGNGLFMNWYYHAKIALNMRFFWGQIIRLVPAVLTASAIGAAIGSFVKVTNWLVLLASIAAYTVVYCIIMWLIGLDPYEKSLVKQIVPKFHTGDKK